MEPIFYENLLIKNLFTNQDLRDKVLPFLATNIFEGFNNQQLIKNFLAFNEKYEKFPTVSELKLVIESEKIFENLTSIMNIDTTEYGAEFMNDQLEEFFRKKLVKNAMMEVVEVLKDGKTSEANGLPDKLREALAFSFDTSVGFDFAQDAERMYNYLHNVEKSIPTGLIALDGITDGGFYSKSLTLFLGAPGVGKTTIMNGIATNIYLNNSKVLYVTLEMPEEKINTKTIANLMDTNTRDLKRIPKMAFHKKYSDIVKRVKSNLMIKEYPAGSLNTNKLRNLLKDLKNKKKFVPEIVFVDYLALMTTNSEMKNGNTNDRLRQISVELTGLASEYDVAMVSAGQLTRDGIGASDLSLKNTADSIGMIHTAALVIGIIQTDDMRAAGVYDLVVLKNRYGENCRKFSIGIDYNKMRISNIEDNNDPLRDASDLIDQESREAYNSNPIIKKSIIDFGEDS